MSYAASLLSTYPASYGPTNLLSDDLIQRTSYDNLYPPNVPYMSSGRLLSDDLAFNQINYDPNTYRSSIYPLPNNQVAYPKPVATYQRRFPPNTSFVSLNDISEYSDSLATASNTNTASSMARSINGPVNTFSNYNPLLSNDDEINIPGQSIWSAAKPKPKDQTHDTKGKATKPTNPPTTVSQKKPSEDELDNDRTPIPSPRQSNPLRKPTPNAEINKQTPAIDIQAWVNDTEEASAVDEKAAEQAWSVKINQLHQAQAQREKEKAKSSRALPIPPKKVDTKPKAIIDPKSRDTTHQAASDSYFDSLFDGDYFRKPLSHDYSVGSSLIPSTVKKNRFTTNSFDTPNSKNPKQVPPRKPPRYEPPTQRRPPPTITTTSWKKQWPTSHQFDTLYPYYSHQDITHRDLNHKDTDERFREALQKVRADRAEQQQKEQNEKTAKRLHYGDYVRESTKKGQLQNPVKPSPWSDFMDIKKGNLYSISQEEKKELYNQSKSYGERIRYRNFAIQHASEASRSHRHSVPLLDEVKESEPDDVTPRQPGAKSHQNTSRSNVRLNADENLSDYEANPKPRQKNVRYAKYDSFGRIINGAEENEDGNPRAQEGQTIESDSRYKKR